MNTHLAMIYKHVGRSDVDFHSKILVRFGIFLDFVTLTHFQDICLDFCGQATKGQTVIDNIYICRNAHMVHIVNLIRLKWCIHLSRSLYLNFNYLVSVIAGGPVSPRGHM